MNVYERETVEFQPVTITVDDSPVTSGIELQIRQTGTRPVEDDWAAPTTLGEEVGVMVSGLTNGSTYVVWCRITDSPEIPVLQAGKFRVA